MVCKVCGRTIANEDANFCEYCGTSFRPGTNNKIDDTVINNAAQQEDGYTSANMSGNASQTSYGQTFGPFSGMNTQTDANGQPVERPMTFGNWLAIMLLPFIPFVGTILFLVLLFMWSFDKRVPASRKNWARATLVMLGVCALIFSLFMSYMGTTDLTTLMNSLYAK